MDMTDRWAEKQKNNKQTNKHKQTNKQTKHKKTHTHKNKIMGGGGGGAPPPLSPPVAPGLHIIISMQKCMIVNLHVPRAYCDKE